MDRKEATERLKRLQGVDLRGLADKYGVTVWIGGKLNKGWVGHTIERFLGLPLNSAQSPNFGSWELKVVPLRRDKNGTLQIKETMAITMIDPVEVKAKPFEQSHLLLKLQKELVVARTFESRDEKHSFVYSVAQFDLENPSVYRQVKADYEFVRNTIKTQGFDALTGRMGILVQPRTKGPGHGSKSRAFYARKQFVALILGLTQK